MMRSGFVIFLNWGLVDFDTLCFDYSSNLKGMSVTANDALIGLTYSLLEASEVCGAQSIRFRYYGNQVDSRTQSLHNFNIQRLEGMACRSDKIEAGMNSEIYFVNSAWLLLLQHVRFMLVIKKLDDR